MVDNPSNNVFKKKKEKKLRRSESSSNFIAGKDWSRWTERRFVKHNATNECGSHKTIDLNLINLGLPSHDKPD